VGLPSELEDLREQQRAISRVLRAVARSVGIQPVLEEVAEACRRLCEADHGSLWLLRDGLLHVGAHQGEQAGAAYDVAHPHPLDRTTAAGRAALERRPVHIPDVVSDPEYTYRGPRFFRTMLGVPIMFEDDLIGVVVVVRRERRPFTDDHAALVQTFADQAAIALTNARLIEAVERQRTELSRFVSPQVADLITSDAGERLLAGHRAYISCLFFDLRGFTAFAETAAPEELFDVLREYHALLGHLIPAYQGTLEHFAGDGVMVFFNDPLPVGDHELQAVRLALAAQARFAELAGGWRKRGIDLALGIGIEAGYATLGRIGFEGRFRTKPSAPRSNRRAVAIRSSSARCWTRLHGRERARPRSTCRVCWRSGRRAFLAPSGFASLACRQRRSPSCARLRSSATGATCATRPRSPRGSKRARSGRRHTRST
jgi:class 3 adenylate cyclase/putative methionine-R-sulfoxide reductase with GAF domain